KGARDRYDGARRNPWNEVECGSHYARALASWSVLLALSGYRYSAPERRLTFMPRVNAERFQCFFTAGSGWGTFIQRSEKASRVARLETHYGEVRVGRLKLRKDADWKGALVLSATGPDGKHLSNCQVNREDQAWLVDFGEELVVPSGKAVDIKLVPQEV
ncbi:MAG: hypothetical protein DMG06_30305, partial [Acidobacteria bacterium]